MWLPWAKCAIVKWLLPLLARELIMTWPFRTIGFSLSAEIFGVSRSLIPLLALNAGLNLLVDRFVLVVIGASSSVVDRLMVTVVATDMCFCVVTAAFFSLNSFCGAMMSFNN